jgi:electron transport complex protein RnfE
MADIAYAKVVRDGLWNNNQALVALLGLCPLLATTTSATNGLGMGIATTAVLVMSNITVSLIRHVVRPEVRIPVYVVVIASFVTIVELLMKAYYYELHKVLGIFVALIVVNCTILGRAEAFASKNPVRAAAVDGLSVGVGVTGVLVALGGVRELVGQGTLFAQAHLMLGDWARVLELEVGEGFHGALAAILPPGAFIGLGFLIALKNVIDRRAARRAEAVPVAPPEPAKAG